MKYSQFNTIIPYEDKFALFNSFTQKFILIDPVLKDLLIAGKEDEIDELKNIHPTFYNYIVEEEFLIDNKIDEVEKVKDVAKRIDENYNSFLLTINPTMNCNFKCWYCYETHIKKSSLTEDVSNRIKLFISKTAHNPSIKNLNLALFGGEPLLYFKRDVIPIILKLKEECSKNGVIYSINFTTNGYLINEDFIKFFKDNGLLCSLQITLDGYREKHDAVRYVSASKGSYDEIIRNIKMLLLNNFFVRLRVNYTDQNIDGTDKIIEEFRDIPQHILKEYLLFDFHRVWQNYKPDDGVDAKTKSMSSNIREAGARVTFKGPNNVLYSCYADKRNSAVINYNGDIFKCTARDFTTVKRAGYLNAEGELVWEDGYLERRMSAKFRNKPCLSCRLLPICNGGCSQHALEAMESGHEYCVYSGSETEKDRAIRSKIDEIVTQHLQTSEV
ncbi:MAG: radical SAM protein [Niabella sp.]